MERNENGMPMARGNTDTEDMRKMDGRTPMSMGDNGDGCGGGGCLDEAPLAYVYAPSQKFRMMYSPEEALAHGTLFEELYKPMEVYGRE